MKAKLRASKPKVHASKPKARAVTSLRSLGGALCLGLFVVFTGCGGEAEEKAPGPDTGAAPVETTDIRKEPLTPALLKDPRMADLRRHEYKLVQDYVNEYMLRRQAPGDSGRVDTLAAWLDSNLTVGEVIALQRGAEKVEPEPPHPLE